MYKVELPSSSCCSVAEVVESCSDAVLLTVTTNAILSRKLHLQTYFPASARLTFLIVKMYLSVAVSKVYLSFRSSVIVPAKYKRKSGEPRL